MDLWDVPFGNIDIDPNTKCSTSENLERILNWPRRTKMTRSSPINTCSTQGCQRQPLKERKDLRLEPLVCCSFKSPNDFQESQSDREDRSKTKTKIVEMTWDTLELRRNRYKIASTKRETQHEYQLYSLKKKTWNTYICQWQHCFSEHTYFEVAHVGIARMCGLLHEANHHNCKAVSPTYDAQYWSQDWWQRRRIIWRRAMKRQDKRSSSSSQ